MFFFFIFRTEQWRDRPALFRVQMCVCVCGYGGIVLEHGDLGGGMGTSL